MMWTSITEAQRSVLSEFMGDKSIPLEVSFNEMMPIIIKINNMDKAVQFAIFKTYVSCTVESGGKFYKNFSFSHAEYVLDTQPLIEAIVKLALRFVLWYNENKVVDRQLLTPTPSPLPNNL